MVACGRLRFGRSPATCRLVPRGRVAPVRRRVPTGGPHQRVTRTGTGSIISASFSDARIPGSQTNSNVDHPPWRAPRSPPKAGLRTRARDERVARGRRRESAGEGVAEMSVRVSCGRVSLTTIATCVLGRVWLIGVRVSCGRLVHTVTLTRVSGRVAEPAPVYHGVVSLTQRPADAYGRGQRGAVHDDFAVHGRLLATPSPIHGWR